MTYAFRFSVRTAELELLKSLEDGPVADSAGRRSLNEKVVDRIGSLRIDVLADEHAPPHFRVTAGSESANYRIDDGAKINGGLDRFSRNIRNWYADNRGLLVREWNAFRSTDCEVGPVEE